MAAGPLRDLGSEIPAPVDRSLLLKCISAASLVLVLWIFNFSLPLVAISVGALILIIGRVKSGFIHQYVDWTLLLFFAAPFVVIRGFELSGASDYLIRRFEPAFQGGPVSQLFALSGAMVVLSNLVNNVPAVLLLRPLVQTFSHSHSVWLVLAATSTLAGIPRNVHVRLVAHGLLRPARRTSASGLPGVSRFSHLEFPRRLGVLDCAGSVANLSLRLPRCGLPPSRTTSAPRK